MVGLPVAANSREIGVGVRGAGASLREVGVGVRGVGANSREVGVGVRGAGANSREISYLAFYLKNAYSCSLLFVT